MKKELDLHSLLGYHRNESIRFSEFMQRFEANPAECLKISSTLIAEAIQFFGYEIVVRSGEPTISYNIFKDLFANGTNAVFGQEPCIKQIVDVIESMGKESSPSRGIVLVGPPASGKTNIIDLISMALEEFSKETHVKIYSFSFRFESENGKVVEFHPPFMHNPILLIPTVLRQTDRLTKPRHELFEHINSTRKPKDKIVIPTYYQHASLDKVTLDILENLQQNPRNADKSLYDLLEEYVRVEEIEFSNAQAKGIANVDDIRSLSARVSSIQAGEDYMKVIREHLPGSVLYDYDGALVSSNRGLLHIHDAFGIHEKSAPSQSEYKPLLMLLGSGKVAVESTQASLDTNVVLTTNIEEMEMLDRQLTSSKLLDRIEKVPVNYLVDANSEVEILKRDLANMREKYDVDPNLLKVASYFSVMTRLLPPMKNKLPDSWSQEKKDLFLSITPEQKLFIYASQSEDPVATILKTPHWHPFRNEALKLGIDLHDPDSYYDKIVHNPDRTALDQTGLFEIDQLQLIDDEFMRILWHEHYPNEGKSGISVRQLQNIMRNTIAHSDGFKVHVGTFFSQLKRIFQGGPSLYHWLVMENKYREKRDILPARKVGPITIDEGRGDFGDYEGLYMVARGLYYTIIQKEITVATVDRDPEEIALDLRRYIQNALLARAIENKAFSHIMVPKYTYIDPKTGQKIEKPDLNFMKSIEKVLAKGKEEKTFRTELAQRFLDLQSNGELHLEASKSVYGSRNDNLLNFFGQEYALLLGHRKTMEEINAEQLRDAFFQKRNLPKNYLNYARPVRDFVEKTLDNMSKRFGYSRSIALDTIIYALRKNIIDFAKIIV